MGDIITKVTEAFEKKNTQEEVQQKDKSFTECKNDQGNTTTFPENEISNKKHGVNPDAKR